MTRKILHLDLDAFFCAVEEQHNPDLRGEPFAVGGRPDQRGVVASCSYAARAYGVSSAMPMARAVSLCPDLIIVPNRHRVYGDVSREVIAHLHNMTPFVEQISIDEAFLDVTGLPEPAVVLARRLQAEINESPGLPCSLGVATNKLVAKIANNIGKVRAKGEGPPNAIQVVPPGEEAAFLAPLPTHELWGVGPKTAERLAAMGVYTIGDIAAYPEATLCRQLGKLGSDLHRRAQGIDNRPVEGGHDAKSISKEVTFAQDISEPDKLKHTLRSLSDGVGRQLRRSGMSATTVKLKLRWADFTTLTRQVTLSQPTRLSQTIYAAAGQLFDQTWEAGKPVRLLGVGVSGLGDDLRQLSLWDEEEREVNRHLEQALDNLRDRFGERVVRRASDLKRRKS